VLAASGYDMRMDEASLRERVCEIGRVLFERGHNAPGDGNITVRIGGDHLLSTPTGTHKGRLAPDQIVLVDVATGLPVAGGHASTEMKLHLAVYRARPDVRAIVHAHSPNAVALTVAGLSLEFPVVPEAIMTLGSVPTVPYRSPGGIDVAEACVPFASRGEAFVLERHGPVALGRTLDEAYARLEVLEHTAKITAIAHSLGGATPIAPEEASRLRKSAISLGMISRPE
jgi:L-fuculose-phosphate aldolase